MSPSERGSASDLLIWAADPSTRDEEAIRSDARRLDWQSLVEAADFHGLTPLLAARVADERSLEVPEEAARRLRQARVESARRHLFLSTRLGAILDAFGRVGVPVL